MFKEFFVFEIKNWLKNPIVYIFFIVNFGMVLAATLIDTVTVGADMGNVNINSPFSLMSYAAFISLVSVVMTTTFVNQAALKDFTSNFHSILFATPMKRFSYLLGRFSSSVFVACIPLLGVLLAVYVAPFFYDDPSKIGPNYFAAYLDTFLTFLLPNTILISTMIFALAIKFRSTTVSFIGAVFLLIGYLLASTYVSSYYNEDIALLADPFGVNSISAITKYWTLNEKNTQWLTFTGPIFMNRILWMCVAVGIFLISYFNFSFSEKKSKNTTKVKVKSPGLKSQFKVLAPLPSVSQIDNVKSQFIQLYSQFKSDFWETIKTPAFIIIIIFSIFNLIGGLMGSDTSYGVGRFPVTYIMLEGIEGSLHVFVYAIITYFTGAMVWKERNAKFNEIIDASPFPSWIPLASKYLSMVAVVMLILALAMCVGMGMQAMKGYYTFEILLYIKQLFLIDLSKFAVLIAVALFIHVWANNMYVGFFLFILFLVANTFMWGALSLDSNLLYVGGTPSFTYSDMHQYALGEAGLKWYNLYWILFSGILLLVSILFWVRGKGLNFKNRFAIAKQRFNGQIAKSFYSVFSLWALVGGFLFYNAHVINETISSDDITQRDFTYEQMYKKYEDIAQPRIVALDHTINLYPHSRKLDAKTEVVILNKHEQPIDSIHFTTSFDYDTKIELPNSKIIYADEERNYFIYQLSSPLLPGDSLTFFVQNNYEAKGIENEISNEWINKNGSFVHSYSFMPAIGYKSKRENHNPSKREEFGLAPSKRMPKLEHSCSAACNNTYISTDSDWIRLSSTISTSNDQIAIAPGTLLKEWKEKGRNFYRYELDKPVLNFYSFLSAQYEVKREKWDGVDLEVYYHKTHEYNVDKMMLAMRASLDYFSKNFSPYPHKQARIIEFPRYSGFAQAFPGTMPYSESKGFIANLKDEDDFDMVFHTVAHEMAHQWWGHQTVGAHMQGATMLSETFAQYSAMAVLEKEYGKEMANKLSEFEMDHYLRRRGGEQIAELPLMKVENQAYIHYQKGSVVMNAIRKYIQEDSLNQVLQNFLFKTAYQEPPYTNSNIFISELEQAVPDSFQYLIDDMFKDIILYNNKAMNGEYKQLSNGQYELTLSLEIEKYRADKKGMEQSVAFNDYIFIGVYAENDGSDSKGKELYYNLHKFNKKETEIKLILDEKPHSAGIDPNHLLIDRVRDDNVIEVVLK
ncbi:MAG: M1 family aminopeptidase [Saprospiraceae bacterium]